MAERTEYIYSLIDDISPKLDNINKKLDDTDKKVESTGDSGTKSFNSMGGSLGSLATKATGAIAVISLLTVGIKKCADAAREDELAQNKLNAALGYTSIALGIQTKALAEQHKMTQGEIVNVQQITAQYFKSAAAIELLTPAIINMATATDQSTESIAEQLGAAIKTGRGLRQYGLDLKDCKTEAERLEKISRDVNDRFGAQATAVENLNSPLKDITTQLSEAAGNVGKFFLAFEKTPIVKSALDMVLNTLKGFNSFLDPKSTVEPEIVQLKRLEEELIKLEEIKKKGGDVAFLDGTTFKKIEDLPKTIEETKKKIEELKKKLALPDGDGGGGGDGDKPKKKKPTQDTMVTTDYRSYNWGIGPPVELVEQNWDAITALQLKYQQIGMSEKDKEFANERRRYEEELEQAGVTYELKQAAFDVHLEKMNEIDKKWKDKKEKDNEKLAKDEWERKKEYKVAAIDSAKAVSNAIFSIAQQSADRERNRDIQKVNDKYNGNKQMTASEIAKQKEIEAIEKEAFEKNKRRSIAQALIDGALGAAKTVATMGWPAAIPMLIVQGITTAAQVAVIASQSFKNGGRVKQEPGVPSTGDKHIVRVNPGEVILTPEQYDDMTNNSLMSLSPTNSSNIATNNNSNNYTNTYSIVINGNPSKKDLKELENTIKKIQKDEQRKDIQRGNLKVSRSGKLMSR